MDLQKPQTDPNILYLAVPLVISILYTSSVGLFTAEFYSRETLNWQTQSIGQDMMDLFLIAPVLLTSSILAWKGNKIGTLLWAGTNLYLIYTFCIFCFDVHFNSLFIFYCINLGLSFYSFLYFIHSQVNKPVVTNLHHQILIRTIGIYLVGIAVIFTFLWLSEIIPAMLNRTIPDSLAEVGLPTNGVHVIDLSVFLPGLFIIGTGLLRNRKMAFILAPVILVFFILMDITIGGLMVLMYQVGLDTNLVIAAIMAILAMISLVLLIWYFKEMNKELNLKS